jgi:hypothetical protein
MSKQRDVKYLLAFCNKTKKEYTIRIFYHEDSQSWVADFSAPVYKMFKEQEAENLIQQFAGRIGISAKYNGCPYCGNESFYICPSCKNINCKPRKNKSINLECICGEELEQTETAINGIETKGFGN